MGQHTPPAVLVRHRRASAPTPESVGGSACRTRQSQVVATPRYLDDLDGQEPGPLRRKDGREDISPAPYWLPMPAQRWKPHHLR